MMIGEVLKKTRTIYGYKASENSYLSEIENNKKQPSLELLKTYSKIYGMKLSSLISLSEKYEEAINANKGQDIIRRTMIKWIDYMSSDLEIDDE